MRKILFLLMLLTSIPFYLHSQVGINTEAPDASSALDIQSKSGSSQGVLLPRMTTADKNAITNPAESLLVYDTDIKCVSQNIGTASQPQWVCLTRGEMQFFYMPSIVINTSTPGTYSLSLYDSYESQFATPDIKSTGAPDSIPYFTDRQDLYYYITYYDPAVLDNVSIADDGTMAYTVLAESPKKSFMNVVFVIK